MRQGAELLGFHSGYGRIQVEEKKETTWDDVRRLLDPDFDQRRGQAPGEEEEPEELTPTPARRVFPAPVLRSPPATKALRVPAAFAIVSAQSTLPRARAPAATIFIPPPSKGPSSSPCPLQCKALTVPI